MTWKRVPHDYEPTYRVWSIDEQDTRILAYGWSAVTVAMIVGAGVVAIMDTALAWFGLFVFLGLMIPCATAVAVANHQANQPDESREVMPETE